MDDSWIATTHAPARARAQLRGAIAGLMAVLAIASATLFVRLGEPGVFWDESYYFPAAARYELGYASLAAHPPLGLMLIAAGDRVAGQNGTAALRAIAPYKKLMGKRLPTAFSKVGMRWMAATFGVVASALVFLLMLELVGKPVFAFFATTPFLLDTALLTHFRGAMLDPFQLCFAVAALLCLAKADRRPRIVWLVGFGAACGLATMVRANALLLLAGGLLPCWRAWARAGGGTRGVAGAAGAGAPIAGGAMLALGGVFLLYLLVAPRAMPQAWPEAHRDAPFVTEPYGAYIQGRAPLSPAVAMAAASDYRHFMAADVAGIGFKDRNGSSPWSWLLARNPITYRWDSDNERVEFVALVPNVAAWLISLFGVAAAAGCALRMVRGQPTGLSPRDRPLVLALLGMWLLLFGSSVVLAQLRTMYLYHQFLPLMIGWALAALLWSRRESRSGLPRPTPKLALLGVAACFSLNVPFVLHGAMGERECLIRTALTGPDLCRAAWQSLHPKTAAKAHPAA